MPAIQAGIVFFPEDRVRVWLYARPADMRKQFDGLAALVKDQLAEDPLARHLFVFINRRRTLMKGLYFDRGGYCLWCKRLDGRGLVAGYPGFARLGSRSLPGRL